MVCAIWNGTPPDLTNLLGRLPHDSLGIISQMILPIRKDEDKTALVLDLRGKKLTTLRTLPLVIGALKSNWDLCSKVHHLDLSHNNISSLDNGVFNGCAGRFSTLDLSRNVIDFLCQKSFEGFVKSGNPQIIVVPEGEAITPEFKAALDSCNLVIRLTKAQSHTLIEGKPTQVISDIVKECYLQDWRELQSINLRDNRLFSSSYDGLFVKDCCTNLKFLSEIALPECKKLIDKEHERLTKAKMYLAVREKAWESTYNEIIHRYFRILEQMTGRQPGNDFIYNSDKDVFTWQAAKKPEFLFYCMLEHCITKRQQFCIDLNDSPELGPFDWLCNHNRGYGYN